MPDDRAHPVRITSLDDPRVAVYRNQKDAWLRVRSAIEAGVPAYDAGVGLPAAAAAKGLFMAEGDLVVRQLIRANALERGPKVLSVLISDNRAETMADALAELPPGIPVYVGDGETRSGSVGCGLHRGVLACGVRPPDLWTPARLASERRLIVVLEDLANHDNVGGIFRSVGALAGPDDAGVLLSPRCCDPLYRKALRVSIGQALHVPYAVERRWPEGLADLVSAGFEVLALTPASGAADLNEIARAAPDPSRRIALLLGAEGPGLTAEAMAQASRPVRIPVLPEADSLNVATAGAIALHRLWPL